MVTMQKYLTDLHNKGIKYCPHEVKLAYVLDLHAQIDTLEAKSKLYAGIIRQLSDELKQADRLAQSLEDYLKKFDDTNLSDEQVNHWLKVWIPNAREIVNEWKLAQ